MNAAVIVAGGSGERSGLPGGKQLALLIGRPVVSRTIEAFDACEQVDEIVVVTPPERVDEYVRMAIGPVGSRKVTATVAGGESRQASVAAGLAAVSADAGIIIVHDGARPLVAPELIARAIDALEADEALSGVVVGHPVYDTLKSVDARGRVTGTPDHSTLWVAQTPQVFRAQALRDAHDVARQRGYQGTDDASLVEAVGGAVAMLAGPRDNIKITVPGDLLFAERLLTARAEGERDG